MGTLRDLAHAGVILTEGLRFTIFDESDEVEDLEADVVAYYDDVHRRWIAEFDEHGLRYVTATHRCATPSLVCVTCRAPLTSHVASQGLHLGDRCPGCGEPIHRPILPPA